MAKKFVRGITDIKTINKQDFDTNNVNDLLSDGKHNYIHRKKQDGTEEYHNLTNNLKTIQSDDTDLVSVTNYNNTTNSATIRPKHDAQKEQVLESSDETILIEHGENGTEETTSVDVNFDKVQAKLSAGDGLAIENNQIVIKPKNVETLPANNGFYNGAFMDAEWGNPYASISLSINTNKYIQLAFRESVNTSGLIIGKYRFIANNVPSAWKEMTIDSSTINSLLEQKQNTLTSNTSIGISGTGLRQLYTQSETYTHANAFLKTHVKSVSQNTSVSTAEEEFNFLAKMDKGKTTASFILNEHDAYAFRKLIDTYGENGTIVVSTCMFSMADDTSILTFLCNTSTTTNHPYVISFSDIMPSPPSNNSQHQAPSVEKTDEIADKTVVTDKEQETE